MLQFVWACIQSALDSLGLEAAAAIISTVIRQDGMTVTSLLADILLLTVIIVAVEKALKLAKQSKRIKWFLTIESTLGFGSLCVVWAVNGADFDARIADIVSIAGAYLVFPWVAIFVLSPLMLVWFELRQILRDLGGATISRTTQATVFGVFLLGFVALTGTSDLSGTWGWSMRILAASILTIAPTMIALISFAHFRRYSLRRSSGLARWRRRPLSNASWQEPRTMDLPQQEWLGKRFKDNQDAKIRRAFETSENGHVDGASCECQFCRDRRAALAAGGQFRDSRNP